MGDYRLRVFAVGGHGCDREALEGESIAYKPDCTCPDCLFKQFVEKLKTSGNSVSLAQETHWPGTDQEIVDDVLNSRRLRGQFKPRT